MKKFNHQTGFFKKNNNADIYYEITGNQQGHPILFLHGGMLNIESFNGIVNLLAHDFKCIGMDSRGHGSSTYSGKISYQLMSEDVAELLSHLKIDKINIIGHSDGGVVALKFALAYPNIVNSLVLIGAQWCIEDSDRVIYESVTPEFWQTHFSHDILYYEKINQAANFNQFLSDVKAMWLDDSDENYPGREITNIKCHSLIIRGDEDFLVSRQHTTKLADMLAGSNLLNIPFCGHSIHEEVPDVVYSYIAQFYQKFLS